MILSLLAFSAMMWMPATSWAENAVQYFGSAESKSWTASSETTDILSGSTVTIEGVVMTFGGTDNYWTWNSDAKGVTTNQMPNDGSNGITSLAVNDAMPAHGGYYTFNVTKDGFVSIKHSEPSAGPVYFGELDGDGKVSTLSSKTASNGEKTHTYEVAAGKTYYFMQAAKSTTKFTSSRNSIISITYSEPVAIETPEITGYHVWNFIEESSTWSTRTTPGIYDELALTGTFGFDASYGRYTIAAGADGAISFKVKETGYLVIMGKGKNGSNGVNLTIGDATTEILKSSSGLVYCKKIEAATASLVKIAATSGGQTNVFSISWIPEGSTQDVNTQSVTLDSKGFATYYPAYTVSIPEGLHAYYISAINESEGTITPVKLITKIPANAAVILTGTAGETYNFSAYDLGKAYGAYSYNAAAGTVNVLHGVYKSSMTTDDTKNFYAYGKDSKSFKRVKTDITLPLNRAYFTTAKTSAPAHYGLFSDDVTTGIITLNAPNGQRTGETYNLQGQRCENPRRGIYIQNGRKIILK